MPQPVIPLPRYTWGDVETVFDDLAPGFGFEFGNVSVLMVDPNRTVGDLAGEKFSGVFADANAYSFARDCVIRINIPVNDKSGIEALRNTAAHELFHCVQYWSYPKAAGVGDAAKWWVEGSAEFFANQVQIDVSFWADNGEQLEQRFNSWAAK